MTYSAGSNILAADYNGFVSTNTGNVNGIWGAGVTDRGYGQSTTLSTVSAAGNVTATQWASLVNTISSIANHQGTTITSRTAPVAGNTIAILSNLDTDLNNLLGNRGDAYASGTTIGTFTGTTSKTTATGSGTLGWTITFTHTVTFANANAIRYFFNSGGLVKLMYGKSSTGTDHDADWNTLAGQCGNIFFSGYVNSATNAIAGTNYTGTTRIGGSGGTQTTLATTTGFYNLTANAAATTIFQLNNATSPYTTEYIRTAVVWTNSTSPTLTFTTTWVDDGTAVVGSSSNITGGTGVTSPATAIGAATAPTTLVNVVPPEETYLTNTWGTPTIAASVA